jgi:hypothetical protein
MKNRYVPLPSKGAYHQGGAGITTCEIREVPEPISDSDVAAFVAAVCSTPRGLWLGGSGSPGDPVSIHWITLRKHAAISGVAAPEVPVREKVVYPNIVDGVVCDENGRPLRGSA